MRAGQLRDRVDVQVNTPTRSSRGEDQEDWSGTPLFKNVPARIRPLRTGERFRAQQANPEIVTEITIRYHDGITSKHRLKDVLTGQIYSIEGPPINVKNRNRELMMTCKVVE